MIIEILVGKLNPHWDILHPTASTPYSYQTWLPIGTMISLLDVAIRNGTMHGPFPYFLSTCQLRVKDRPDLGEFKYMDYLDLDVGEEEIKNYTEFFCNRKNLFAYKSYMVWFTGLKGFRVVKCHKSIDTVKLSLINPTAPHHVNEYLASLPNIWQANDPESRSEWLHLMDKFLDPAPWFRNRGVKFDVHPHPKSGRYPQLIYNKGIIHPDSSPPITTVIEILRFWRDLYGLLKLRLETMLEDQETLTRIALSVVPVTTSAPVQPPLNYHQHTSINSNYSTWLQLIPRALKLFFLNQKPAYFKQTPNDYFIFGSQMNDKCRVHNRIHSSKDKAYYVWKKGSNFITAHCHSSAPSEFNDGHKIFFQEEFINSGGEIVDARFLSNNLFLKDLILKEHTSFHVEKLRYVSGMIATDTRFSDGTRVNNLPFTLLVKAGMGCGKTQGLKLLLEKIVKTTPKIRILAITTRRTCTGFLSENFGCIPYVNLSSEVVNLQNLPSYDRICISMESLHKISRSNNGVLYVPKFNVVILDEIETVLSLFTSATMESKRDNYLFLADICKASDRVFAMDALLNEKTFGFFYDIGLIKHSINYSVLFNVYNMNETCYVLYRDGRFLDWKNEFINSIVKGKRVALVSSKKNAINVLFMEAQYECIKRLGYNPFDPSRPDMKLALIITGASPDQDKATAITCNSWSHLDFIAISPAITVGNSDMSEWDEQFCLFGSNITAATALQMSGRFRKIRSAKRHIMLVDPSDKAPIPSAELLKKRNIREVYTKQELAVLEEAKYLVREKILVVENHEIPDLISIKRPVKALQNLLDTCKEEEFLSRTSIFTEFVKHLDYANILYQILSIYEQDSDSYKASKAALNTLRKESLVVKDTIKDKKEAPSGDTKSREMIKQAASEKLILLGAPFGNKKLIEESITTDEFIEFQKTHSLIREEYINHYLFSEHHDCSELEFKVYFEKLQTKPNDFPKPMYLFIQLMNTAFEAKYYASRKHYFSVHESLKCKEFSDAISAFYASDQIQRLWQVHTSLFPKGGRIPDDPKSRVIHFIENYCPFFGIYFDKIDCRKHRKLFKDKLAMNEKDWTEEQKELTKPYYSSDERNPRTRRKVHKNDTLYCFNKSKIENVHILSKFMHSVNRDAGLLPEKYRFRKYFLQNNNSSN